MPSLAKFTCDKKPLIELEATIEKLAGEVGFVSVYSLDYVGTSVELFEVPGQKGVINVVYCHDRMIEDEGKEYRAIVALANFDEQSETYKSLTKLLSGMRYEFNSE